MSSFEIKLIFLRLKKIGVVPDRISTSKVSGFYVVNLQSKAMSELAISDSIISGTLATGMASNQATAWKKSLSEWAERMAFLENLENNTLNGLRRSDGFAAFPIHPGLKFFAERRARKNAVAEATERYSWSHWWDYGCAHVEQKFRKQATWHRDLQLVLGMDLQIESLRCIRILTQNSASGDLFILLLKIDGYGYITGGACGPSNMSTLTSAFVELTRHSLAFKRMIGGNISGQSKYEKRLFFFASGQGNSLVEDRLKLNTNPILLPSLEIDSEVQHRLKDIFYVHRCLFINQPDFLGGPIERLCL